MSLSIAFIDGIGGQELLVIMLAVLLLFGSDKLPGLAKGMGKSIREFKKAASGVEEEIRQAIEDAPDPKRPDLPAAVQPPATVPRPPFDEHPAPQPPQSPPPPPAAPPPAP